MGDAWQGGARGRGLCLWALVLVAMSPAAAQAEIDVLDYDLSVALDVSGRKIDGEAVLTLVGDGAPELSLDLVGFEVDEVQVGGQRADFRREQGVLRVVAEVPEGQEATVLVRYRGEPSPYVEPWGAWGVRFEEDRVFTLNVIEGARHWFPSHDVLRDRATVTMRVMAPESWVVAAPGTLESVVEAGEGAAQTTWRADWPLPTYQVHFAAAPYQVIEQEHDGVPHVYYLMPETDPERALETLRHAPDSLALFVSRYGPYPFPKVGFDEIDLGGAVEQASCVSIGGQILNATNRTYEEVIAHEMAHAWFQGVVVTADWDDLWLSEGMATYHEALYHAHARPDDPDALSDYVNSLALGYRSVAELGEGVFAVHDPEVLFGVTTYRKGALVFHMLRYLIGDEVFDALLLAWLDRHRFGVATTEDFQALAEEISGRDLEPFFAQWVYGAGWPDYRLSWQAEPVDDGAGYVVEVALRQVQTVGGPFTLPVELELVLGDQRQRVVMDVDGAEVRQRFEVPFEPEAVALDPGRWLLKVVEEEAFVPGPEDGEDVEVGDDVGANGDVIADDADAGLAEDAGAAMDGGPTDAGDAAPPVGGGSKGGCSVAMRSRPVSLLGWLGVGR